jgi:hypothetical protein
LRISGFHGGMFAASWRFWSLMSGSQTPLRSGSARTGAAARAASTAKTKPAIANAFANVLPVMGLSTRWSGTIVCADAKEKRSGVQVLQKCGSQRVDDVLLARWRVNKKMMFVPGRLAFDDEKILHMLLNTCDGLRRSDFQWF